MAVKQCYVGAAMLCVGLIATHANADSTERVNVDSAGVEAVGGDSETASISADGRFIAFQSEATNLVANDTNGVRDIFVHDRIGGVTDRVSVDSSGGQTSADSLDPSISGDGRFVAFASNDAGLVAGDTNGVRDIFVHDRLTGATERVSVTNAGTEVTSDSDRPSISADGRFVAFDSEAVDLVAGDTNGERDVFVHDRQTGVTERVNVDSAGAQSTGGPSYTPALSAGGRFVAFYSLAANLVAGDHKGFYDVFVHDRQTGETERVSVTSIGGELSGGSTVPSISADGRFVTFESFAPDAVSGDTNMDWDVFVHDRQTGVTERVSVDSAGAQVFGDSFTAPRTAVSEDGRFVAFKSDASNLVAGDTNGERDIFVRDRQSGTTERVSIDSAGVEATGGSSNRFSISADGRFVAFDSYASNLVADDTNSSKDVFVHEATVYTISVSATPAAGGTVGGGGTFVEGSSRTVTATANAGYVFVNWTEDGSPVSTEASYTFTLNADRTLVANFNQITHTISVSASPSVGGVVSGGGTFVEGSSRTVTATANAGYAFVNWIEDGSPVSADASYIFSLETDRDLVAHFTEVVVSYTITVSASPAAGGTVGGGGTFAEGSLRTVTATANAGYAFVNWTEGGNPISIQSSHTFLLTADRTLVANFVETHTISVSASPAAGGAASGGGTFAQGSSRTVTATANAGYGFVNWTEDGNPVSTQASYTFTLNSDRTLVANFSGSEQNDLLIDFGSAGLWEFLNNARWIRIDRTSPAAVATGDLDGSLHDEAIVSFGGLGLWAHYNNMSWMKLHNATPVRFVTGDFDDNGSDDLVTDFGAVGIWVKDNNGGWMKLHNATSQDLAVGDLDGDGRDELIADFGPSGLWVRYNNSTWKKLHNASPVHIATGDLDGNGQDELIADFGPSGLWVRYNNSTWKKLHNASSQGIASGDLDGSDKDELIVDFGSLGCGFATTIPPG